jgi:hypothetical protein
METKYAGADWIKSALKVTDISPLGEETANILGELYLGIYHLESRQLKKVDWSQRDNIDVVLGRQSFSTYDNDKLTKLCFLAHHRAVRVEIHPHSFKYLRLTFSRRGVRTGQTYLRHPSLDDAVEKFKNSVSLPEVKG